MSVLVLALLGCTPEPSDPAAPVVAALDGRTRTGAWRPRVPVAATFGAGEVVVRAPWDGAPEVGLSLRGWGEAGAPVEKGGRTVYPRRGVTEWWVRRPSGLEQGFTVAEPPRETLVLDLVVRGAEVVVDADGLGATLATGGAGGLRYDGLAAWDGAGTDLPARMEVTGDGVRLVVDVSGARGAVTVDPLLSAASWSAEGNQGGGFFGGYLASGGDVDGDGDAEVLVGANAWDAQVADDGAAFLYPGSPAGPAAAAAWTASGGQVNSGFGVVSFAGDVNGDGYDDVIVGAERYDGGLVDEGRAALWLGSAAGLAAAPGWSTLGGQAESAYGCDVAGVGDVNGDGYDDVVVGARDYQRGQYAEGRASLYLGSAAGLRAAPAWRVEGGSDYARLGDRVAAAGDVNGDGYDDVLIGAAFSSNGADFQDGRVDLYLGSAAGLAATPAWTATGARSSVLFGVELASGDVNGDGFSDLLISELGSFTPSAFVYLGSATGPSATPAWTVRGAMYSALRLAAGDLDGDGFDEVVIGSTAEDLPETDEGAVWVFRGSSSGPSATSDLAFDADQPSAVLGAVATGDLDADGQADLVAGAPGYDAGQADEGVVVGFLDPLGDGDGDGAYDAVDRCPGVADPAQLDTDGDEIGNACDDPLLAVTGTPTVGQPLSLVASGLAPGETALFRAAAGAGGQGPCPAQLGGLCFELGPAAVDLGAAVANAQGVATREVVLPPSVVPNTPYLVQAAVARGAGGADSARTGVVALDGDRMDWDGDGLVDAVEVGLGTDPTRADTDRDGLDDPDELRAPYDPTDADTDGDGVTDGADLCPVGDDAADADGDGAADACDGCPADPDPGQEDADGDGLGDACDGAVLALAQTFDGPQRSGWLGMAVASAGDVNGDGFADVIAGAPQLDHGETDEGAAGLMLGSAVGLRSSGWLAEADVARSLLGWSVASAGDVDGDGFDDVVVGLPGWDAPYADSGQAWVYAGSAAGLGAAPAWVLPGTGRHGAAVASAGDVDGDGFDDVLVGADRYYGGQAYEGAAFLYRGSANGLAAAPSWAVQGDRTSSYLGQAVASAGDLDGDGLADVVVGAWGWADRAPYGGAAFVFGGTPSGLEAAPSWSVVGDQANAYLGYSVGTAGDTNADGYADLVVGAYGFDGGAADEGAAYVYLGSRFGLGSAADWTGAGAVGSLSGQAVGSAGDVDGDGFDDVLVGAPSADGAVADAGAARVYLGTAVGPAPSWAWSAEGNQAGSWFGGAVAGAGDVDGDGLADVVVGAKSQDTRRRDEGRVQVFLGQSP